MAQGNRFLKAALWYLEKMGWSVIPVVSGGKKPLVKWERYQKERPTREEVIAWWTRHPDANIGIVTGQVSGMAAIDIDTDEGRKNIERFLPDTFVTPTASTPRGGSHLYCRHVEGLTNKAGVIPGTDFRGEGGYVVAPPSVNGNGKAYAWQGGLSPVSHALMPLPEAYVDALIGGNAHRPRPTTGEDIFREGVRDENLFHIAYCLAQMGNDESYVRQTLIALMRSWGEHDEGWAESKVQSALKRIEKKSRNLTGEVRDFVETTNGVFLTSHVVNRLHATSREEKKQISKALLRMKAEGLIKRVGDRDGSYCLVDGRADDIDIWSADTTPLEIRYPLGIEELVHTYGRNVVVIAGEPDAGKTAFLLNFARLNMDRHRVLYFSSEMGSSELRNRLVKFNVDLETWRGISWKERSKDFPDVIEPDAVNIIDFLEVHDEFYRIGGMIKEVFDRLGRGIALIALQKPKGRDEGLGGQRGLEKPRLYLALEPGKVKIVKAKNWVSERVNPNGFVKRWRLGGGCHFREEGPWRKE